MNKNKIYDMIIIILLYIGVACIPFDLIPVSAVLVTIFKILAQIIVFVGMGLVVRKSELKLNVNAHNRKNIIWFIPTFVICFSNFFTLFDVNNSLTPSFSVLLLVRIILSISVAFNEELIFRVLLQGNMKEDRNPIIKILISSAIFGACHLTHFLSTFDPGELMIVGYTFGIGFAVGMIYEFTGSFSVTFLFHGLYNMINNNLAENWITYGNGDSAFFIANAAVAGAAVIYLVIVYLKKINNKQEA